MSADHLAKIYRDRAEECFQLARTARDAWTRKALEDLAYEMLDCAEDFAPTKTALPGASVSVGRKRQSDQDHG